MAEKVHGPSNGYYPMQEQHEGFTFLDLKNRGLKELPGWVFNCPNLETLGLDGNDFEDIPGELRYFQNLKALSISYGKLKKITISLLPPNLEKLYVGDNKLTVLPSFANTKLKTFWGENNEIETLPKDPFPETLTSLNLDKNRIEELPPGFEKLKNLKSLYLSDNQLTSLPIEMETLSLDQIELNRNPLEEIPLAIKNMKKLTVLEVKNCKITKIPDWIAVDGLYIKGNPLKSWPKNIPVRYLDYRDAIDFSKIAPDPNNPYRNLELLLNGFKV